MVSSMADGLIYDIKLSSVGPGYASMPDMIHEPTDMDLAMKLHYLKGIYYFGKHAFEGLTARKMKEPLFILLDYIPAICGRFRRDESGRPYIKCNDCGLRFLEAKCEKTMEEWLEMITMENASLEKYLTPNQIIGPELAFSPLVLLQYTKFKCGGMAVGLSWAHVLGDAFSVAEFCNLLGKTVAGEKPNRPINFAHKKTKSTNSESPLKDMEDPLSVKRVDPVGDNWITVNNCKMEAFSLSVTATQLSHLQSKIGSNGTDFSPFEALSAVIWQCIAKIRRESEPKVVTICKMEQKKEEGNNQLLSVVKAAYPIVEAKPSELAALMKNAAFDQREKIENAIEKDNGVSDFIVYGANLTFSNLDGAKLYEFDYRGEKPVYVSYQVDGVGDEGAVLVLPGPPKKGGRIVMAILPENEVSELKSELKREWFMD